MASVNLLSSRGLTKRYGGLVAVDSVDFELPEGQIRALIGPNGAGKSTFVGMLSGRIGQTAGEVRFDGKDISALPAHRRVSQGIAYTFQITSVFSRLSLRENVALAARRGNKLPERQIDEKAAEALSQVELDGRIDEIAGDLSYGHQRLLEIAMGIVQQPKLLILDEPTQGLADVEIDRFTSLIADLSKTSTVLLIEHNMDVVMDTADYITVLNFGEVLAEGTPSEIQDSQAVQAAYLGTG